MARRPKKGGKRKSAATKRKASSSTGRARPKAKGRPPSGPVGGLATGLKRSTASELELKEAREQQAATGEILKVIAGSPSDVQPVFEAIVSSAARLIGAFGAGVYRFVDGVVHLAAITSTSPAADAALRARYPRPIEETDFTITQAGEVLQVADTEKAESPRLRDIARERG